MRRNAEADGTCTMIVPPMFVTILLGVSAIKLSPRKAVVLNASGAISLEVSRDKTEPSATASFNDWLTWIDIKAARNRKPA